MIKRLVIALVCWVSLAAQAGTIPFDKFRLLREGMNEAQVLLAVGQPDRESTVALYYTYERIWYYIPEPGTHDPWLTTIRLNTRGKVIQIERIKP